MNLIRVGGFGGLVTFLVLLPIKIISAQTLDEKQIALIRETAAIVCDTVKEAKGSKTGVELQGEIEAKLSGFAKKLAGAGISGQGKFTNESFEGLSQEATAAALRGDQYCRERIFNRMFDRLEVPKDKKTTYKDDGLRSDLRSIQSYLRYAPVTVSNPVDACSASDADYYTKEFRLSQGDLSIKNHEASSSERCASGNRIRRETESICTAALADLDDAVEIWSLPNLKINCLTGDCFQCQVDAKWRKAGQDWMPEKDQYRISYAYVYLGGERYLTDNLVKFKEFGRAVSRLVSTGSDRNFCKGNPQYCR